MNNAKFHQSINASFNQPMHASKFYCSINQSMLQPINQSMHEEGQVQPISQCKFHQASSSMKKAKSNQSTLSSFNKSTNQCMQKSKFNSTMIKAKSNQSISSSFNQSTNQCMRNVKFNQSTNASFNQSMQASTNHCHHDCKLQPITACKAHWVESWANSCCMQY